MTWKTITAGVALAGTVVTGGVAIDRAVETPREEASRYESVLQATQQRADTMERTHAVAVSALVSRRAQGDEPTAEEWLAVETAIDEARKIRDTPYLQKLDRFIERMDATDKGIRTEAFLKLEEL